METTADCNREQADFTEWGPDCGMPGILGENPGQRSFLIFLSGWFHQILHSVLDLVPPPFRGWAFALLLKHLGKHSVVDYQTFFRYPWTVSIGDETVINHGCKFYGSYHVPGIEIKIGSNCAIAPNVHIYTAGHDYSSLQLDDIADSVTVGDSVWIGARSILLPGVKIGDGCVIGAGTLVAKDIPPYSIAVGVPAKVIGQRTLSRKTEKAKQLTGA